MLPSQRALFDLPREVCYLNAAGWSPLPLAVQQAGREGVSRKGGLGNWRRSSRPRSTSGRARRRRG